MTDMKLLRCDCCGDVFSLQRYWKECMCGAAGGRYLEDDLHAVITSGTPLAFHNTSFRAARDADARLSDGTVRPLGERFEAWIIPMPCPTVERVKEAC